EGTNVLCRIATEYNIKRIVFFSSVAVYGIRDEVTNEKSEPSPDSPYGASKLAGEKVLTDWALDDPERRVLIIRPTVVYGANNLANMFNLIRQIESGYYFHLGKASVVKSIAYVENVVQATLWLSGKMKKGIQIYNYSDEPQLTTRQIAEYIAQFLDRKIRFTLPAGLGPVFGYPFDLAIKITGKNLPISSARIKKLGTQTFHSAEKIFSEGFEPQYTTIEGLERMVAWYKSIK
nr:NAD-dependent epimerase/dehydratase family protein [Cyclobacteriaceae bacterium]